jgi:COMPASS component SWD2
MSFHDNKFIRYFKGHKGTVVSLAVSPLDDHFISSSRDDSVRLWDLRQDAPQGKLHVPGSNPLVAFDPSGKVFAIALHSQVIRLYDIGSFEAGPFETGAPTADLVAQGNRPDWTDIKFSADGKKILVSTNSEEIYLINGFDLKREHVLRGHSNRAKVDFKADFTPDAQFVMCGSQDGRILFWDVELGRHVTTLEGHREPPNIVAFNPKFAMFASADSSMVGAFDETASRLKTKRTTRLFPHLITGDSFARR